MTSIKKFISYILIGLVIIITIITLLGIWEIIDLGDIGTKIVGSLLVIFAASAVILFIFAVLIKDDKPISGGD